MAVISKGQTFATGDQVTAVKLNNLADNATFASGAVDNVSTQLSGGAIVVKDGGVSTAKIADDAVETAKILDSNVTKAKIEDVADYKVLGNVSGAPAAPAEVAVLDEDDMASDSDISLATQQSIKAYVDTLFNGVVFTESFESAETNIPTEGTDITFTHSLSSIPKVVQVYLRCKSASNGYAINDEILIGDYGDAGQMQNAYCNATTVGWGHMYSGSTFLVKTRNANSFFSASSPDFVVVIKAYS